MLALKIEIDGHPPITVGEEDWLVLSSHVTATRAVHDQGDELHFHAGTMSEQDGANYHSRWKGHPLAIGSRVVITVIEADSVDAPTKRYRSDKEVQESPFTEEEEAEFSREERREKYLELKKEFEGEKEKGTP